VIATDAFGNALGSSLASVATQPTAAEREDARQAIASGGTNYFAQKLIASGVNADDARGFSQSPELQDVAAAIGAMGAASQGGSTGFDDLSLEQQTAALRAGVRAGGTPSLYDRMREPIEEAVGTEQPYGEVKKLPIRPTVTINGTSDITGSFITAAANTLDRANAAVAYLVDKVGPTNAEAAVLGIQLSVGGLPRTALTYAGNYVLGGVRADLSERLSGVIADQAFDVSSATPERAKDIWTVSRALGGFGVDTAFGTARDVVQNVFSSRAIINSVAGPSRPGGYRTNDVDMHGNLSPQSNRAAGNTNTRADNFVQSHHPIQDKWAEINVPGYNRANAPGLLLESNAGSAHAQISAAQRALRYDLKNQGVNPWGTTIQQEFNISYKQMIDAGVSTDVARKAIKDSYKYFDSLGAFK